MSTSHVPTTNALARVSIQNEQRLDDDALQLKHGSHVFSKDTIYKKRMGSLCESSNLTKENENAPTRVVEQTHDSLVINENSENLILSFTNEIQNTSDVTIDDVFA